jgi:hypothetical protein
MTGSFKKHIPSTALCLMLGFAFAPTWPLALMAGHPAYMGTAKPTEIQENADSADGKATNHPENILSAGHPDEYQKPILSKHDQ